MKKYYLILCLIIMCCFSGNLACAEDASNVLNPVPNGMSFELHLNSGDRLYDAGRTSQALTQYLWAKLYMHTKDEKIKVYKSLYYAYKKLGDENSASEYWSKLYSISPQSTFALSKEKPRTSFPKLKPDFVQSPKIGPVKINKKINDTPQVSAADLYAKAESYKDQKNYSKAFEYYKKAADNGHADAQYRLGQFYDDGKGVSKDYTKAADWYRKAAIQKHADASFSLACYYKHGYGVPKSASMAFHWFQRAAILGHAYSQFTVGESYENGEGVLHNYTEAAIWYRKAAEQDFADAQYMLGSLYEDGRGVAQNYSEAIKWYKKAANNTGWNIYGDLAKERYTILTTGSQNQDKEAEYSRCWEQAFSSKRVLQCRVITWIFQLDEVDCEGKSALFSNEILRCQKNAAWEDCKGTHSCSGNTYYCDRKTGTVSTEAKVVIDQICK